MTVHPAVRGLLVLVVATTTACASGPTTIGSNSHGLAIEEFFTKDPHDVRVALRTDDRAKRGPAEPSIVLRATVGARAPLCYVLALVPVDASSPREAALEKAPAQRRWYVFGLSKEGLDTFERARREVQPSRTGGGNLNVEIVLRDVIEYAVDPQGSPQRIDFAVDRQAGYFTMSPERTIRPVANAPVASKAASPCGAPT